MASFSIETTAKALPIFNGNQTELESFLITAELLEKTLSDTAKIDFLQYVYHAKLTSNVRTAIGSHIKPENFQILKSLLEHRYKTTKTIPELHNKLNSLHQGRMTINNYKEKILYIIDNLNKLGIEELGNTATTAEQNVIMKLNNKLALDTFKQGLNETFKSTIYASRPKTLQEAADLAIELENEQKSPQNEILHIRRTRPHNTNNNHGNNRRNTNTYNNNYRTNTNRFPNQTLNRNNHTNNSNNTNYNRNSIHRNINQNDTQIYRNNNNNNQNNRNNYNNNFNSNSNNNNNFNNRSNNNYNNHNNRYNNNRNNNRNNRRQIHCIRENAPDEQENILGAEYEEIPERQQ